MKLFVFGNERRSRRGWWRVLDNLGKGASGAAVQNLNIALGLEESRRALGRDDAAFAGLIDRVRACRAGIRDRRAGWPGTASARARPCAGGNGRLSFGPPSISVLWKMSMARRKAVNMPLGRPARSNTVLRPKRAGIVDHQPRLGARHAGQLRQRMLDEVHVAKAQRAHDHRRREAAVEMQLLHEALGVGRTGRPARRDPASRARARRRRSRSPVAAAVRAC